MWPKKSKKITVAFHGVRITVDAEMPIIRSGVFAMLREHPELELSRTREGVLSVDQLMRDIKTREDQIALLRDADGATHYSASKIEIERTAKLLAIQAQVLELQAPVVFVGDGQTASAIDFCFAAAQAVAEQGDGEISYQCKALLQ
ncbi:hypothetical protein ELG97_37220, partial [Rhizobium leguminosarum]|uniref:hypothetical protein n=1 Tax=Rhizobium leguminosarum TaxID=384 RepID=UPI001031983F